MDFSDMFNALYYREVKEENLQKQMEKVIDLVNVNFKQIIESSFRKNLKKERSMVGMMKILLEEERLVVDY